MAKPGQQQTRQQRRERSARHQPFVEVPFHADELADNVDIVEAHQTGPNQGAPDRSSEDYGDRQDVQDFDQAVEIRGSLPMLVF